MCRKGKQMLSPFDEVVEAVSCHEDSSEASVLLWLNIKRDKRK